MGKAVRPRVDPELRKKQRLLGVVAAVAVLGAGGTVAALALPDRDDPGRTTVTDGAAGASEGTGSGDPADDDGGAGGADAVVLGVPAAGQGRCAVPTPALLRGADVALDGTVTGVDGAAVTLEVGRWYAGDAAETGAGTVELRNPEALRDVLGGVPDFAPGQRWLVAGSDGSVAVCGFTAPWSPAQARLYTEAFGS